MVINEAYQVLSRPESRSQYDRTLPPALRAPRPSSSTSPQSSGLLCFHQYTLCEFLISIKPQSTPAQERTGATAFSSARADPLPLPAIDMPFTGPALSSTTTRRPQSITCPGPVLIKLRIAYVEVLGFCKIASSRQEHPANEQSAILPLIGKSGAGNTSATSRVRCTWRRSARASGGARAPPPAWRRASRSTRARRSAPRMRWRYSHAYRPSLIDQLSHHSCSSVVPLLLDTVARSTSFTHTFGWFAEGSQTEQSAPADGAHLDHRFCVYLHSTVLRRDVNTRSSLKFCNLIRGHVKLLVSDSLSRTEFLLRSRAPPAVVSPANANDEELQDDFETVEAARQLSHSPRHKR